jgi:hypothetical protein
MSGSTPKFHRDRGSAAVQKALRSAHPIHTQPQIVRAHPNQRSYAEPSLGPPTSCGSTGQDQLPDGNPRSHVSEAPAPHTNLFNSPQVIGVCSPGRSGAGSGSLALIPAARSGWLLDGLRPEPARQPGVAEERPAKPKVGVPSRYSFVVKRRRNTTRDWSNARRSCCDRR